MRCGPAWVIAQGRVAQRCCFCCEKIALLWASTKGERTQMTERKVRGCFENPFEVDQCVKSELYTVNVWAMFCLGFFFFVVLFKCYSCQACVLLFFKINHFVYSKGRGKKPHILTGKVLLPVSSGVCSCNRLQMCVKVCNVFNHSKNLKHQSTVFNCFKKKKKRAAFCS